MKRFVAYLLISAFAAVLHTMPAAAQQPVVRDNAPDASKGLKGRNIALWQSHGNYYNIDKNQWIWQRAHLMQTIEDLYSTSYVLDLLVPMLENAGAYVMLPRERDLNNVEVTIDADSPSTPDIPKYRPRRNGPMPQSPDSGCPQAISATGRTLSRRAPSDKLPPWLPQEIHRQLHGTRRYRAMANIWSTYHTHRFPTARMR